MSERTPLLRDSRRGQDEDSLPPPASAPDSDHPIFLRAAHSPWKSLDQNTLGYVRGGLLAYMVATAIMLMHSKTDREDEHTKWRIPFQFSTITWASLLAYQAMATSWTVTHMHWPDINPSDRRWESRLLRFLSPPAQSADSRRRIYFSLFYAITHVFALMNTANYWAVLVPNGHGHFPQPGDGGGDAPPDAPPDDGEPGLFNNSYTDPWNDFWSEGWFKPFCLFNLYTAPTLFVVVETLFLNSIRRPEPVPSHVFGTVFAAGAYLAWAGIGKALTGHNAFFWLDKEIVGSREAVAAYCTGFVASAPAMFSSLYGLIGMREKMTGVH